MKINQKQTVHRGIQIPRPIIPVELHVAPEFSGRVVVHIKDGHPVCDYPLINGEQIATFDSFLALARSAGWIVTPFRNN